MSRIGKKKCYFFTSAFDFFALDSLHNHFQKAEGLNFCLNNFLHKSDQGDRRYSSKRAKKILQKVPLKMNRLRTLKMTLTMAQRTARSALNNIFPTKKHPPP